MDKELVKKATEDMYRLIERIENESGVFLATDRRELRKHSRSVWRLLTPFELGIIVQTWKYNMVISKPYLHSNVKRALLSEISRGEL